MAKNRLRRIGVSNLIAYGIVGVGALIMLIPFYFMFIFATHTDNQIMAVPPPLLPGDAFMMNLNLLLQRVPHFWQNTSWSVYIAVITTLLNLELAGDR